MATIKDVARLSGYGISTVSYALKGSSKIPLETQEKIKEVARQLNYVPNASARALKTKRNYNIGIFVPGFDGGVHTAILSGIASVFRDIRNKYKILITLADSEFLLVYEKQIDIAMIIGGHVSKDAAIKISEQIPLILVDNSVEHDNIYNTYIDNKGGIISRVKDFYSKGSKKFIYMRGTELSAHNTERYIGFIEGLKECGLSINDQIVLDAYGFSEYHGYACMKEYLKNEFEADALICANDELAIGSINALKEKNIKIPEDLLVSGFDNIDKGNYLIPSLSTISIDWYDYGVKLGRLALDILADKKIDEEMVIKSYLVDRISGK